jgi:hypothetical protein
MRVIGTQGGVDILEPVGGRVRITRPPSAGRVIDVSGEWKPSDLVTEDAAPAGGGLVVVGEAPSALAAPTPTPVQAGVSTYLEAIKAGQASAPFALGPGPQPFGLLPEPPAILTQPDARAIVGEPGLVVGGKSPTLGRAMMRDYGIPGTSFSGWQPHHLIPTEAMNHPVIQKIGMNLDDPSNGIMLPEPDTPAGGRLPTHRGYHSLFSNMALAELDRLDVNLPISVLQLKVFGVQQRLRFAVIAGLPLYYSKGGTDAVWQLWLSLPLQP